MRLIAFIVERAVIVRILDHLGAPRQAPRTAPIRDPPWTRGRRGRDAIGAGNPRALDPPPDRMPDYENQRQALGW